MAQVDHSERDMVSAQEVDVLTVKADEQGSELIHPGKAAFVGKASLVDVGVEQTFAPAFGGFAVALVFGDVRDQAMVEADLAGFTGIEGAVSVEERPGDGQSQALHALESSLQMGLQVEGVVVVARNDAGRSQDVAVGIHDGQDVAGLGALATLIGHPLTALFGQGMAAIPVQLAHVKVGLHRWNAGRPDPLQTPVGAPLTKVIVHCLPTALFFVSFLSGRSGPGQSVVAATDTLCTAGTECS